MGTTRSGQRRLLALLLWASALWAQPAAKSLPSLSFEGQATRIVDGDTAVIAGEHVRLEGIDAPEAGQRFGAEATRALAEKILDRTVRVEWRERDKYGRVLGHVYFGDRHINRELLSEGYAWHFKKYNSSEDLAAAEVAALVARLGLWADECPVAPWDYRHPATNPQPGVPVTVYVTMKGAKYHLETCTTISKSNKIAMPLADAKRAHEPCALCHPPR